MQRGKGSVTVSWEELGFVFADNGEVSTTTTSTTTTTSISPFPPSNGFHTIKPPCACHQLLKRNFKKHVYKQNKKVCDSCITKQRKLNQRETKQTQKVKQPTKREHKFQKEQKKQAPCGCGGLKKKPGSRCFAKKQKGKFGPPCQNPSKVKPALPEFRRHTTHKRVLNFWEFGVKPKRNGLCPCGSKHKFSVCCQSAYIQGNGGVRGGGEAKSGAGAGINTASEERVFWERSTNKRDGFRRTQRTIRKLLLFDKWRKKQEKKKSGKKIWTKIGNMKAVEVICWMLLTVQAQWAILSPPVMPCTEPGREGLAFDSLDRD